jgi:hypothetical protein
MEDRELQQKLLDLEKKIDAIYVSAERTRRYFLVTIIVTLLALVLPLVASLFVAPSILSIVGQ